MWLDAPSLGNLALDFLHTLRRSRGGTTDLVRTPETMAAWLLTYAGAAASRLHEPLRPPDGRLLLDEAQRLRRDVGGLVATYAGTGSLDPGAALGINRVLDAYRRSTLLVAEGGRPALAERMHGGSSLMPLGPIAEAVARLVCTVGPDRIRSCASDRCKAWFVDTSRGGRRRWCSMATCGNRQKASTHRSRRSRTRA
jgi:predicted RNA-binding Zn ribbon-like protein